MSSRYLDFGQRYQYKHHSLGNGYSQLTGKFILPVAEDEPTTDAELDGWVPYDEISVHAPILFRSVAFDTTKEGGPPLVPAMADAGSHSFVGGSVFVHCPRIHTDAWTHNWQVEGEYEYAVAGPVSRELQNGLILGSEPVPTVEQVVMNSQFGSQTLPTVGTIRDAGTDAKACYAEAVTLDLNSEFYFYRGTALFPGCFFSTTMATGETLQPSGMTFTGTFIAPEEEVPPAVTQEAAFNDLTQQ